MKFRYGLIVCSQGGNDRNSKLGGGLKPNCLVYQQDFSYRLELLIVLKDWFFMYAGRNYLPDILEVLGFTKKFISFFLVGSNWNGLDHI